jgi:hypothetical protein
MGVEDGGIAILFREIGAEDLLYHSAGICALESAVGDGVNEFLENHNDFCEIFVLPRLDAMVDNFLPGALCPSAHAVLGDDAVVVVRLEGGWRCLGRSCVWRGRA